MTNEEFFENLQRSLTSEVLKKVLQYAVRRCEYLSCMGIATEPNLAEHLVADAISDTATGDRTWNPETCNLSTHLCGVIRSRTSDWVDRHKRNPHAQFEDAEINHSGASSRNPPPAVTSITVGETAKAVLQTLWDMAQGDDGDADEDVRLLLLAYIDGLEKRRQIIDEMEMTERQYDNARKRLHRLIARLPKALRDDARQIIGGRS